jgi:hypothetical protein
MLKGRSFVVLYLRAADMQHRVIRVLYMYYTSILVYSLDKPLPVFLQLRMNGSMGPDGSMGKASINPRDANMNC